MATSTVLARRWLPGIDTMLGQVRTLFLGVVLASPVFGMWGLSTTTGRTAAAGGVDAKRLSETPANRYIE